MDGWALKSDSFTDYYITLISRITSENGKTGTSLKKGKKKTGLQAFVI
jgi:hypothetical protein